MRTATDMPHGPGPDSGEIVASGYPRAVNLGEDLRVRDYLRTVFKRRWLIAVVLGAGLLGGLGYNWTATPIFDARATLQIESDTNILALDRPLVDQRDWTREFLPTQVSILASREIARMAHEELQRANDRLPAPERLATIPSVEVIAAGRRVESIRDTRLVSVGFRSPDPVMAARVANALAEAYVRRTLELRSKTTGEASEWLTRQVEEQRKTVEASEAALQRYRKQHGADALVTNRLGTEQQNIVVQKLGELQAEASRVRAETIEKEAQYKQLLTIQASKAPLDTLPAIASNSFIQGLKGELSAAQRQLEQSSKVLGERHPEIVKAQTAVQAAQHKLETEISGVVQAIRNDYEAAQARDRAIGSALERQKAVVRDLNGKAVEYTALEREASSNREVLDRLLQRAREASLARELQTTNSGMLDVAQVPAWPAFPRKTRNLLVALAGSGMLAIGLAFLLELGNTRISSSADLSRYLGMPILGVVPLVKLQAGQSSLLLTHGTTPEYAELLRALRTNLVTAYDPATARTLLVTSSQPGEGKTVATANLAVALARLGQRVLLVDADLRKPQLHRMFEQSQQPGLADVLNGSGDLSDDLAKATVRSTAVDRLWLLPAGSASRHPADLLGSERFRNLLEVLRGRFDWVVLDSPPVLVVTDACIIAHITSGVLFVVGAGQTSREVANAAVSRLDSAGGHVVGALLNRASLDQVGESALAYDYSGYGSYCRPYLPYYQPDQQASSSKVEGRLLPTDPSIRPPSA